VPTIFDLRQDGGHGANAPLPTLPIQFSNSGRFEHSFAISPRVFARGLPELPALKH
jgi:hypothetical protein